MLLVEETKEETQLYILKWFLRQKQSQVEIIWTKDSIFNFPIKVFLKF